MIKRKRFPRIFFGWWTLLASSLISLWGLGYHLYGFSALFKPIASELGFSRAATSVPAAISRLGGAIEGPIVGVLIDKFGPRWVILFGVFLFGLGLTLMYFVNSLWAFYVVWGAVVGLGSSMALMAPIDKAIAEWFVRKRGLAQSIRWAFRGLGGVAVLPLVAWLIITQGWRRACLVGGVVLWLIGLPLAFFCFKQRRPEYYGLLPDGATVKEEAADTSRMIDRGVEYAAEVQEVEFTLRQAVRTPILWLLVVATGFHGLASASIITHSIPFLTDAGVEPLRAAGILAVMPLASIPARLAAGLIADRLRIKHLRFLLGGTFLLEAAGIALFLLNQSITMVYVWFILDGVGVGGSLVLGSLIRVRYFGRKALGSIGGFSTLLLTPIAIAAPIYVGWVYDTTGSYISAFTLIAVVFGFSGVLMFLARPPKPPAQITDIRKFL